MLFAARGSPSFLHSITALCTPPSRRRGGLVFSSLRTLIFRPMLSYATRAVVYFLSLSYFFILLFDDSPSAILQVRA